ncbi:DUF2147 domain-containing protein [Hyphobacterium sp.]|jgi:uncharacterized protein (DUF2147 family)|uniref:DUF2147 domain-containing protein n=1 Tax=Hyphobacterium sp. TaxID=2004662 RepID=UPI003BAB4C97
MRNISVALIVALSLPSVALANPHEVFGLYAVEDGTSHVEIADCGDGTPCGTVVWIDPASIESGLSPGEVMSPATGEPVLGLTILRGLREARRDWRGGTIYSPSADRSYGARLRRLESGSLEVKGCIGPVCQTQIWTPVAR